jgi:class 3 adenylate cyclase
VQPSTGYAQIGDQRGNDGIAVFPAAPIMAAAEPSEILVSNTVKNLVIGSDIGFEDRRVHTLNGFDGRWQLYSVMQGAA